MLRWSLTFLIISILTAIFGMAEIVSGSETLFIALYFIFTGLFLGTLLAREILISKLNQNKNR